MIRYFGGPINPTPVAHAVWKSSHGFCSFAYPWQARLRLLNRLLSKPHGMPLCDDYCTWFWGPPLQGCLWPGETEAEFGYPVCANATKEAADGDHRDTMR